MSFLTSLLVETAATAVAAVSLFRASKLSRNAKKFKFRMRLFGVLFPWHYPFQRFSLTSSLLDMILGFLIKNPDDVEVEVGCLVEKREKVENKHGTLYAKLWFVWWGFWMISKALIDKLPGKTVVDALKSRLGTE
jgi:hypothetical protein